MPPGAREKVAASRDARRAAAATRPARRLMLREACDTKALGQSLQRQGSIMAVDPSGGHPAMDYAGAHAHLLRLSSRDRHHDRPGRADPAVPAVASCPRPRGPSSIAAAGARLPVSQPREASMVTIAVTAERDGEPRVAVSPETVKKLTALGCAGEGAGGRRHGARASPMRRLRAQGATIAASAAEALGGADILLKVRRPSRRRGEGTEARRHRRGHAGALRRPRRPRGAGRHRRGADGDGVHAAHLAARSRWTCCRARPTSPATRR